MTQEQWTQLEPSDVIQLEGTKYTLFCQDQFNRWIAEVQDNFGRTLGIKLLKSKEKQIEKFQLVK